MPQAVEGNTTPNVNQLSRQQRARRSTPLCEVAVIRRLRQIDAEGDHIAAAITIALAKLSDLVDEAEQLRRLFGKPGPRP